MILAWSKNSRPDGLVVRGSIGLRVNNSSRSRNRSRTIRYQPPRLVARPFEVRLAAWLGLASWMMDLKP